MSHNNLPEGNATSFYIRFMGDITETSEQQLLAAIHAQIAKGRTEIHLGIKSHGGNNAVGIRLFTRLRQLPIHLVTYARMYVESAAMELFLAGNERYMDSRDATLFLHPPNHAPEAVPAMRELYGQHYERLLSVAQQVTIDIQSRHIEKMTGLPQEQALGILTKETEIPAEEAVRMGLAHGIRSLDIPPETDNEEYRLNLFE